jgi:hypothetical protein
MTDAERIYQLMVLTARADGRVDPRELAVADELVRETPELSELKDREGLALAARRLLKQKGLIGAVQELAIPISQEMRELAFTCCGRILAADGVVAGPELEVIGQLRRTFGYSLFEIERVVLKPR